MLRIFLIFLLFPFYAIAAPHQPSAEDLVQRAILVSTTTTPVDQETCFSPEEACDIKLMKFIQSAQISIDIAIYDINLPEIVNALVEQAEKIPVRVIVDKRQSKGKHSLVPLMIRKGLNLRYGRQRGVQHDKFTIIDGGMVETGSFNYTRHAAGANNENQFYNENPDVVTHYREQFEKMWAKTFVIPNTRKARYKAYQDSAPEVSF